LNRSVYTSLLWKVKEVQAGLRLMVQYNKKKVCKSKLVKLRPAKVKARIQSNEKFL